MEIIEGTSETGELDLEYFSTLLEMELPKDKHEHVFLVPLDSDMRPAIRVLFDHMGEPGYRLSRYSFKYYLNGSYRIISVYPYAVFFNPSNNQEKGREALLVHWKDRSDLTLLAMYDDIDILEWQPE